MIKSKIKVKIKKNFSLLFTAYCLLVFATDINPTVRYVSHTGSSTPPYTTWETAADSIQKAIDICEPGDTVLVANGVYEEYLIIKTPISLIGSSMDSTVIDGSQILNPPNNNLIRFNVDIEIKLFSIKGNEQNQFMTGVATISGASLIMDSCIITNIRNNGLFLGNSSSMVTNSIFKYCRTAIRDECPNNNCYGIYSDNIIISRNSGTFPVVNFSFGGYPTFTNNIVIEEGTNTRTGISTYTRGLFLENNLVTRYTNRGIVLASMPGGIQHTINNIISNISGISSFTGGISTSTGDQSIIQNNIIKECSVGIYNLSTPIVRSDYNLFWNVQQLMGGQPFIGDSNLVADPMFIKDTVPNPQLDFDYHLQAYSPAIDKGNPSIQDVDGSRSDIGMFGGPLGESYKYLDLAPRPPVNLSAVFDSSQIFLKWNRNTEADTSHYNVYHDTVPNFTIDSTKLVSSQVDTFFIQYPPYKNNQYVYKITCVDKQGNESLPSEEIIVIVTSTDNYPIVINDYILYQNYPNPFNPSTTIGYKLKERGYVKLMVYDIKGELIEVLVNKDQEAGYYEVEFGRELSSEYGVLRQLASGIYLYRIEVIGEGRIPVYTDMKKMILIK